jgi:hypothetical protein
MIVLGLSTLLTSAACEDSFAPEPVTLDGAWSGDVRIVENSCLMERLDDVESWFGDRRADEQRRRDVQDRSQVRHDPPDPVRPTLRPRSALDWSLVPEAGSPRIREDRLTGLWPFPTPIRR